jgi:D-psicose/D-tagatose/L-ribulose 3-epimerase
MKFGMNVLLWAMELDQTVEPLLAPLKQMGYDGIEVPLFNLDIDGHGWRRRMTDHGLGCTAVTVVTASTNPISADATIRQAGVDHLRRALDCCAELGATHLVGPFHSALGEFTGAGPTTDEWERGLDTMRLVAEHAGQVGVTLALEALNRFECYFLNTSADLARFVAEVGHTNCRAMYDTFHSHIEEKSTAGAIRDVADVLCHVHISENDRSTPGAGNVRWDETFNTLLAVDYDGWMTIEAFGNSLSAIAAATKIWRQMYESEFQLARDGLAFMKGEVAHRWK